jgi:phosphoribosylformylglycinamidine synthase subunit PurL
LPHHATTNPLPRPVDVAAMLPLVMADADVCSRSPIFERYDAVVRGTTAIPRGYADAGVVVPVPGAPLAVAVGLGGNPRYGALDPQRAGVLAVVESCCNVAAVGARPIALTDCLNFGDADDPRQFGEFVAAVDGLAEAARALDVPFISGNVSLHNTSANGKAVPASPIVACIGASDDVSKIASPGFKAAGSRLHLLGAREDALGGAVVAKLLSVTSDPLPSVDLDAMRRQIALLLDGYAARLVLGAHDISDGGLAVSVCEMAFAARRRGLGAHIDSAPAWSGGVGLAGAWFGETPGFVVEVADEDAWTALARKHGVTTFALGEVTNGKSIVLGDATFDVMELHETWAAPLRGFYDET